jgi:Helix-turn-helix domain
MSGPASASATYYRPAEVAAMLRCSEWWIKEQARRRRIPYAWIGGSYLFTEQHVADIVRLFEVRPIEATASDIAPGQRRSEMDPDAGSPIRLQARPPRRARRSVGPGPIAA